MSTSTASNYINNINTDFPKAGVDNDSQGFRDNFKNIRLALSQSDVDISDLKLNSVRLNQDNDFGQNLIKQAQFKNCSTYVFNDTAVAKAGDFTIDYRDGSYQKFLLAAGTHNLTITNWPGSDASGQMIISVIASTGYTTSVDFSVSENYNVINLSSELSPFSISNTKPTLFNVYSDGASTVFVKKLNDRTITATTEDINSENVTGTNVTAVDKLVIGTNTYQVDSDFKTVVRNYSLTTEQIGNIALLPNNVTVQFTGVINDPNISTTATAFEVSTSTGIVIGATFQFNSDIITDTFTVESIDGQKIYNQLYDSANLSVNAENSDITFTNPRFVGQPELLNLISEQPAIAYDITYITTSSITEVASIGTNTFTVTDVTSLIGSISTGTFANLINDTNSQTINTGTISVWSWNELNNTITMTGTDGVSYNAETSVEIDYYFNFYTREVRSYVEGSKGDLKGQVYVNSNTLYIAYNDYNASEDNWFKVSNKASDQVTSNESGVAASTEFVHNILPYGSIIMWYGSTSTIPNGWILCNGIEQNEITPPDLTDRFVVGAGKSYSPNYVNTSTSTIELIFTLGSVSSSPDGVESSLPAFYTLCYIMKVTGN